MTDASDPAALLAEDQSIDGTGTQSEQDWKPRSDAEDNRVTRALHAIAEGVDNGEYEYGGTIDTLGLKELFDVVETTFAWRLAASIGNDNRYTTPAGKRYWLHWHENAYELEVRTGI